MSSIRRRTSALVAVGTAASLLVGGSVLLVILRRAMIGQFDQGLLARAAALQSLTRFDGTRVEMDIAGVTTPGLGRGDEGEFFAAWRREGNGWLALERSGSLQDAGWPGLAGIEPGAGPRDCALPDGAAGRCVLAEFVPALEIDEELAAHGQAGTVPAAAGAPSVRLFVAVAREPLDRTLETIAYSIAGVGGAMLLAGVAASRWAIARGLSPLVELSDRVRLLGPETLDARFVAGSLPSELRPIAEQIGSLLARIGEAFKREKRFSAAASHELRTPIAELRMLLEVASSRPRSGEEWTGTAAAALGVLGRAQSLCEALLRLSRAEGLCGSSQELPGADVGEAVASQASRLAELHGVGPCVFLIKGARPLTARVDPVVLASIIGNLMENALRHGEYSPGAPVTVETGGADGRVLVDISNAAPSLCVEDLAHFFEPFWRKDSSRTDRDGFGLGLAVARELARAYGGEISADIPSPGMVRVRLSLGACA